MNLQELKKMTMTGGFVSTSRNLVKKIGIEESYLYCKFLSSYVYAVENCSRREDEYSGWDTEKVEDETGLTAKRQREIVKKLVSYGLLESKSKTIAGKRFYLKPCTDDEKVKAIFNANKKDVFDPDVFAFTLKKVAKENGKQKIRRDVSSLYETFFNYFGYQFYSKESIAKVLESYETLEAEYDVSEQFEDYCEAYSEVNVEHKHNINNLLTDEMLSILSQRIK